MSQIIDVLTLKDTKTGKVENYTIQDTALKNRVDNLVTHNNDTAGNAELTDIRVGFDNTQYATAGESIRIQVSNLTESLDNLGLLVVNGALCAVFEV